MRVLQYLWFHFISLATAWLPDLRPVLRLRGFLLRPAFKSCGSNFQIARNVTINFCSRLEIGSDVYMAAGCWLHVWGGITIEDEVQLGPYVVLVAGDHTRKDGSYRYGPSQLGPIRLGRGCWLAAHSTVTRRVTVGQGALLAANSVATRDIPPLTIAGGVPARVISQRSRIEIVS
jgi:acetyltransferase-like isoleucine patch superfamily enzyme